MRDFGLCRICFRELANEGAIPGVYKKVSELRPVRRGYGLAIISTSKGLRTDEAARREKIGGEILCEIW